MTTVMHNRRVQKLGGSSLVVTLPKNWVKRMNIKAGDNIVIVDEGEYLKIMPSGFPSNTRSLALKFTHTLSRPESMELVVTCSYLHGYDKVIIFDDRIPRSLKGSVKAVQSRVNGIIRNVVMSDDAVSIELDRSGDAPLTFLLKAFATALNDALEAMILGRPDEARNIVENTTKLSERLVRASSKESLSICEPAKSSVALGLLLLIPKLISEIAASMNGESSERVREGLEAMRRTLLEILGGMSSGSTKRIETAVSEAARLRSIAESLENEGGEELVRIGAYMKMLSYAIEKAATTVICRIAEEARGGLA